MENQEKPPKKTTDIGAYAEENYFLQHTEKFSRLLPNLKSSFSIKSSLIKKVLNAGNDIKGIRFMFGLEDEFNPNSVRILLVPAGSSNDYAEPRFTFLTEQGYLDHLGVSHNIFNTCELVSSFVKNVKKELPELNYKEITRGGFLGKNSLLDLVERHDCKEVELHFGYKNSNEIIPIFEPFNELDGPYMNFSQPCPNACDGYDPETGEDWCIDTNAVYSNSTHEELDNHRFFRDNYLLDLNDGEIFYEMYYFVSPMVSYLISKEENSDLILKKIYKEKIRPFNELLNKEAYDEALVVLKDTLAEWVNIYQSRDFHYSEV
ncbi:CFI-box-CTERM domain-containing protein [Reichenbachiella sp.]|uniref:CFI-box-CTERM domain-containing protein n=1 Tax=Reichenbachiella sp. TaxID=2184521 RepID=UPI00329920BA